MDTRLNHTDVYTLSRLSIAQACYSNERLLKNGQTLWIYSERLGSGYPSLDAGEQTRYSLRLLQLIAPLSSPPSGNSVVSQRLHSASLSPGCTCQDNSNPFSVSNSWKASVISIYMCVQRSVHVLFRRHWQRVRREVHRETQQIMKGTCWSARGSRFWTDTAPLPCWQKCESW